MTLKQNLKELAYWASVIKEESKRLANNEKINMRDLEISVQKFNAYFNKVKSNKAIID